MAIAELDLVQSTAGIEEDVFQKLEKRRTTVDERLLQLAATPEVANLQAQIPLGHLSNEVIKLILQANPDVGINKTIYIQNKNINSSNSTPISPKFNEITVGWDRTDFEQISGMHLKRDYLPGQHPELLVDDLFRVNRLINLVGTEGVQFNARVDRSNLKLMEVVKSLAIDYTNPCNHDLRGEILKSLADSIFDNFSAKFSPNDHSILQFDMHTAREV